MEEGRTQHEGNRAEQDIVINSNSFGYEKNVKNALCKLFQLPETHFLLCMINFYCNWLLIYGQSRAEWK